MTRTQLETEIPSAFFQYFKGHPTKLERQAESDEQLAPDIWQSLALRKRAVGFMTPMEPHRRPPVLDEMMPDLERLIGSVAQHYTDKSSPHTHLDEMMGEGRFKLAELIDKNEVEKQPTRGNFFKLFKASINNQAKSRVQKYRFTEKRTGVKPPPRHERFMENPAQEDEEEKLHVKQVEVSLDDTELHLQVADASDAKEWREAVEEFTFLFTGTEELAYRQLVQPNEMARNYAMMDAMYLRMADKVNVKIKRIHLAKGLEWSLELFDEVVLRVKQKIAAYQAMTDAEQLEKARLNAKIAQLKMVFGVQIPPSADGMMIKRLFTIAARDQYTKINDQVAEMLESIGAKVPRLHRDMISCYGVLYQENDRRCQSCGLKKSCFVEAANLGLTKIMLSPRLLGSRQTRSPVILPMMEGETPDAGSYDEAEILSYLGEFFTKFKRKDEIYYGHTSETAERQVLLFCLGTQTSPLNLRFCSPSAALKKKLVTRGKSWYPPEKLSTQEVTALIDQHAKEALHG